MDEAKPFNIPKRVVWKAFKRVKANRGAAGVDRQSIAGFEADLSNNLYKLWNRMCSGSYFPPPVRRVEIPKADGGMRPLGIPHTRRTALLAHQPLGSAEVTHPFHPLRGRRFVVLKVRRVSGVETLSLRHVELGSLDRKSTRLNSSHT